MSFEGKSIRLGDEVNDEERKRKPLWWRVKTCLQKAMESRGIKKIQRQKKAKPILPRTCTRMSSLVEPKLARKDDILDHDDARTNGGE